MRPARESDREALDHLLARALPLTAVPFYAAMGFVEEREESIALTPGVSFPAMRMIRAL